MDKKTNIAPEVGVQTENKFYNNFNVGILSMLVGVGTPFILPIIGSFLAPLIFIGGILAVLISKKPIWARLLAVAFFVAPIVIWWDVYEFYVFQYTISVSQPHD